MQSTIIGSSGRGVLYAGRIPTAKLGMAGLVSSSPSAPAPGESIPGLSSARRERTLSTQDALDVRRAPPDPAPAADELRTLRGSPAPPTLRR